MANNNSLLKAKNLRKNMTPQERKFWYCYAKCSKYHWYKQRIIDFYIADFYCPKAKLVIEIDGNQHYTVEGLEYDKIRTKVINAYGIEIIRVTNRQIDEDFYCVSKHINEYIEQKIKKSACLP